MRALQTGRVYVRQNPEDGQLTLEDLQSMVGNERGSFLNRVLCYAACLRGTRQYWMQLRSRLIAMVDTLGILIIFLLIVQLTCTGLNCHVLLMHNTVDRIVL